MQQLRSGLYAQQKFNVLDSEGRLVMQQGLHAITDGGYCTWFCLMSPQRWPSTQKERWWSKRCESVRKDTERTFGVLKKRFYLLKSGFRFSSAIKIDNAFFTCCVLHNMLLKNDNLDTMGACQEDWEEVNFALDAARIERDLAQQGSSEALESNFHAAPSSAASMDIEMNDEPETSSMTALRKLRARFFLSAHTLSATLAENIAHHKRREVLLEHFHQAFARGGVQWLKAASESRPRLKMLFQWEECVQQESESCEGYLDGLEEQEDISLEMLEDDCENEYSAE
eukprot:5081520-Pleurochrysis_carterae.AAC.1